MLSSAFWILSIGWNVTTAPIALSLIIGALFDTILYLQYSEFDVVPLSSFLLSLFLYSL